MQLITPAYVPMFHFGASRGKLALVLKITFYLKNPKRRLTFSDGSESKFRLFFLVYAIFLFIIKLRGRLF